MASAWLCGTPEGNMGSNLCELHLARARLPGRGVGTVSPVCQPCVVGRETPLLRVFGSLRSAGSGCPCLSATSLLTNLSTAIVCLPSLLFQPASFAGCLFFFFCMFLYPLFVCSLPSLSFCPPSCLSLCPWLWSGSGLYLCFPRFTPSLSSPTSQPPLPFLFFFKPGLASILKSINN